MNQLWPEANQFNKNAFELCLSAVDAEHDLGIVQHTVAGALVLDFAIDRTGSFDAGILLAKICLGGSASVTIPPELDDLGLRNVHVSTPFPLAACIGSQYAGWPLSHKKYFAMSSGPMRLLRGKEPILVEYGLPRRSDRAVGVLESNDLPNESIVNLIAEECDIESQMICLCVARTASYPGSIQVVARSVETALHKLHELGFDLTTIESASGSAPAPPIPADDMTALGWTNDSMLYGAAVSLTVDCPDAAVESIIDQIPSSSSPEFGTPFLDIFKRYDYDFYKIDKMLFSPAEIIITNRRTGKEFTAGSRRNDILKLSFGIE